MALNETKSPCTSTGAIGEEELFETSSHVLPGIILVNDENTSHNADTS